MVRLLILTIPHSPVLWITFQVLDNDFAASIHVANEITNTVDQEDLPGKLADFIKLNMDVTKGTLYQLLANLNDVTEAPVAFQLPQIQKVRVICNYQSIEPI